MRVRNQVLATAGIGIAASFGAAVVVDAAFVVAVAAAATMAVVVVCASAVTRQLQSFQTAQRKAEEASKARVDRVQAAVIALESRQARSARAIEKALLNVRAQVEEDGARGRTEQARVARAFTQLAREVHGLGGAQTVSSAGRGLTRGEEKR